MLTANLRRAVRAQGHFPTAEAAIKLLFLMLFRAEQDWIVLDVSGRCTKSIRPPVDGRFTNTYG
jgi:transposase-like protein